MWAHVWVHVCVCVCVSTCVCVWDVCVSGARVLVCVYVSGRESGCASGSGVWGVVGVWTPHECWWGWGCGWVVGWVGAWVMGGV